MRSSYEDLLIVEDTQCYSYCLWIKSSFFLNISLFILSASMCANATIIYQNAAGVSCISLVSTWVNSRESVPFPLISHLCSHKCCLEMVFPLLTKLQSFLLQCLPADAVWPPLSHLQLPTFCMSLQHAHDYSPIAHTRKRCDIGAWCTLQSDPFLDFSVTQASLHLCSSILPSNVELPTPHCEDGLKETCPAQNKHPDTAHSQTPQNLSSTLSSLGLGFWVDSFCAFCFVLLL